MALERSRAQPRALESSTHGGDLAEDPDSYLLALDHSVLAVEATWGVNQQMDDSSVSPPFCKSAFPTKINTPLKK